MKIISYGFQPPKIDETHYKFGDARLGALAIKPDGDWSEELPLFEAQNINYETYACTVFGSTNQIETLHKFLFDEELNYSERYIANIVPIDPPGTDPQLSYEAIRKNGLIPQDELPMPNSYSDYIIPRPMTSQYLASGAKWLQGYEFGHDWVLTGGEDKTARIQRLKAALQFCPIGISVTAWFEENGVYVDNGLPNNHWVMLYKIDDKGFYIYDSYEEDHKILSPDHTISFAKRITLNKKKVNQLGGVGDVISRLWNLLKDLWRWIFSY